MLSYRFAFIIANITFVFVYSLSDTISSFSNIYIALKQSEQQNMYSTLDEVHMNLSQMDGFSDDEMVDL